MDTEYIVGLAILGAVIAGCIIWALIERYNDSKRKAVYNREREEERVAKEAKKEAFMDDVKKALAGNFEAEQRVTAVRDDEMHFNLDLDFEQLREAEDARSRPVERQQYASNIVELQSWSSELILARSAEEFDRVMELLREFLTRTGELLPKVSQRICQELCMTDDEILAWLNPLLQQFAHDLSLQAGTNLAAYFQLKQLITSTRRDRSNPIHRLPVVQLGYPVNWNKMTAEYLPRPTIHDFVEVEEVKAGTVMARARRAYERDDIKDLKIILAACETNFHVSDELGQFQQHLVLKVKQLNRDRGLVD
ncbi:MAG TPA: hypothetical protein VMR98_04250 [Candidatus Polarisedimenticolaceae bacterium]|nr:hypothetical protein [Candidatus Polarisedimenticolaceae bacterium]